MSYFMSFWLVQIFLLLPKVFLINVYFANKLSTMSKYTDNDWGLIYKKITFAEIYIMGQ